MEDATDERAEHARESPNAPPPAGVPLAGLLHGLPCRDAANFAANTSAPSKVGWVHSALSALAPVLSMHRVCCLRGSVLPCHRPISHGQRRIKVYRAAHARAQPPSNQVITTDRRNVLLRQLHLQEESRRQSTTKSQKRKSLSPNDGDTVGASEQSPSSRVQAGKRQKPLADRDVHK
mmetsp:Transcript_7516/g.19201  ORF Transcript_7516/g.19201 Transcript_7516/m.19201 type:complete len:177 (+) Transcript_7516:10-540(+)